MSALNCFIGANAAHIFTDGLVTGIAKPGDKYRGLMGKVFPLPQYNAVLSATGLVTIGLLMSGAIADANFETFDDLADEFHDFVEKTLRQLPSNTLGSFELLVAGWSQREERPRAIVYTNDDHNLGAKELTRFMSPRILGFDFDASNADASGMKLVSQQRNLRCVSRDPNITFGGEMGQRTVGGFCQYTKVERDALTIRVLQRWSGDA